MIDLEECYIKLMKSDRDLRMKLFLYIDKLKKEKKEKKQINTEEVIEKLIEIMNN